MRVRQSTAPPANACCCVLKADVHGFGSLMRAGADAPVRKALADAAARWAPPGAIAETGSGDSALIVDDDPVAMAQAARHFMDDVYMATHSRACASRCTTATVATRARDKEPGSSIVGGEAILCAARVEPVVEPGQIWATEEFRERACNSGLRCGAPRRWCRPAPTIASTSRSPAARRPTCGCDCIGWSSDRYGSFRDGPRAPGPQPP